MTLARWRQSAWGAALTKPFGPQFVAMSDVVHIGTRVCARLNGCCFSCFLRSLFLVTIAMAFQFGGLASLNELEVDIFYWLFCVCALLCWWLWEGSIFVVKHCYRIIHLSLSEYFSSLHTVRLYSRLLLHFAMIYLSITPKNVIHISCSSEL